MVGHTALHVDHNRQRRGHLRRRLEPLGFELHPARNLEAAKRMVKKHYFCLAVLNFQTAGPEIFRFSCSLRSSSAETIVIVLMSEPRIGVEAQLFECGVNDVVAGPHARAEILTKRISVRVTSSGSFWFSERVVRLKNTLVNLDRREAWCAGVLRPLPGVLLPLLRHFLDNPNRVISRAELAQSHIWADSICSAAQDGGKTFDVSISKLRKIIEPDPTHPQIIEAVRGVGWRLAKDAIG
jgi:DNA-binding response OmpR family regulator